MTSMAGKTLRVGITGFGGAGIAQFHHFMSLENCRVTAIHDIHASGLDRARRLDAGLFLTEDFDRFIASGIDIVAICSPDRTHAPYLAASLRAGKHALCEKPLADSLDGCREILHAERDAPGIVAAVQHQMRFLPLHLRIKREIEHRSLGRMFFMEGYYVHNLVERAWLYDDWRRTDRATPLVYSGCHIVDLMRWLSGEEVDEVMAMANHLAFPAYPESDCNVVMLRFRSGMIGQVVVAFAAARPQDHSIRIYGSERSIENNLLFDRSGSYSVLSRPSLQIPPDRAWSMRRRLGYLRRGIKPVLLGKMSEWVMRTVRTGIFPRGSIPCVSMNTNWQSGHPSSISSKLCARDAGQHARFRRRPEPWRSALPAWRPIANKNGWPCPHTDCPSLADHGRKTDHRALRLGAVHLGR